MRACMRACGRVCANARVHAHAARARLSREADSLPSGRSSSGKPSAVGHLKYARVKLRTRGVVMSVRSFAGLLYAGSTCCTKTPEASCAPVAASRKGVAETAAPGPTPPSTCTISCSAVCISDSTTWLSVGESTFNMFGTQLNWPTVQRPRWSRW